MSEVSGPGSRPLTHGAEHRLDVAEGPSHRAKPQPPKRGSASGENTSWSKVQTVDPCQKIPSDKLNSIREKMGAAVDDLNAAQVAPRTEEAKAVIHEVIFDDVVRVAPPNRHLVGLVNGDPGVARNAGACAASIFAEKGEGGSLVGNEIRHLQFDRVESNMIILNGDTEDSKKHTSKSSQQAHDETKRAIIADASDFVVGRRPNEAHLNPGQLKAKQINRLDDLVQAFDQLAKPLDKQLFADVVIRCATDIGVSSEHLGSLQGTLWKHKGEPVYQWLDTLQAPQ